MAGLNRQGFRGKGSRPGRQQGMCRRTNQLDFEGLGKGQRGTNTLQHEEQGNKTSSAGNQSVAEEIVALKKRFTQINQIASDLAQKIEELEKKN